MLFVALRCPWKPGCAIALVVMKMNHFYQDCQERLKMKERRHFWFWTFDFCKNKELGLKTFDSIFECFDVNFVLTSLVPWFSKLIRRHLGLKDGQRYTYMIKSHAGMIELWTTSEFSIIEVEPLRLPLLTRFQS